MDKKLILAVAGSGKTYKLCNEIDENKRNLVLAFTNENINNIYKEILKKYDYIPVNTTICTFDTFTFNYIAKQFAAYVAIKNNKSYLFEDYGCVYNIDLPKPYDAKRKIWNKQFTEDNLCYYLTRNGKFYGERIAKFINHFHLLDMAIIPIREHFDNIYIDEIQDFAGDKFDLLKNLITKFDDIMLVGDYNQHSVSGGFNEKKYPFISTMNYSKYKKEFSNINVIIDENSLKYSRRCSKGVCEYISNKLGITIESLETNNGTVNILKTKDDAEQLLSDDRVIKLVYKDSAKYAFKAINWGYSKGDTFEKTCVILNDNMSGFECDNSKYNFSSETIKNKLYVALSRTKGDLYILSYDLFKSTKYYKKKTD